MTTGTAERRPSRQPEHHRIRRHLSPTTTLARCYTPLARAELRHLRFRPRSRICSLRGPLALPPAPPPEPLLRDCLPPWPLLTPPPMAPRLGAATRASSMRPSLPVPPPPRPPSDNGPSSPSPRPWPTPSSPTPARRAFSRSRLPEVRIADAASRVAAELTYFLRSLENAVIVEWENSTSTDRSGSS